MYDKIHVPHAIRDVTNLKFQGLPRKALTDSQVLTTLIQQEQAIRMQKKKLLRRLVAEANLKQTTLKHDSSAHKAVPSKVRLYRLRKEMCRHKKTIFKSSKVSFSFSLV